MEIFDDGGCGNVGLCIGLSDLMPPLVLSLASSWDVVLDEFFGVRIVILVVRLGFVFGFALGKVLCVVISDAFGVLFVL